MKFIFHTATNPFDIFPLHDPARPMTADRMSKHEPQIASVKVCNEAKIKFVRAKTCVVCERNS